MNTFRYVKYFTRKQVRCMGVTPNPADALSEIRRVQQKEYGEQRLPLLYMPSVVILVTAAVIAAELDGIAWFVFLVANVAGLGAMSGALAARVRVIWRPGTWTVNAGVRPALWIISCSGVSVIALAVAGSATDSVIWQKAVAGAVTALYTAATTRWVENRVRAHAAREVVR
ncbi:hypothetical protein ACFYQA_06020 [Streptomyces sp. NPDC005774]|uniref:hypothetical protein n=1 Tax=Streptomyces sp. NPDC005774 TaxID=3364728 RepID=UPI0036CF6572